MREREVEAVAEQQAAVGHLVNGLNPEWAAANREMVARQSKMQALDMALRYFPAKTAKQLVENAGVFEAYLNGEQHNG